MSAFHPLEVLDPHCYYQCGEADFPVPKSPFYRFPLRSESADDFVALDCGVLYPSSIPVDLPIPYCLHPHHYNHNHHHHRHRYHSLPLSQPPHFINAAADLRRSSTAYQRLHNLDICGFGDRLSALELGLDGLPEGKWKWEAEIKGAKGNRFDHKYKCTMESIGAFEKSIKWSVEFQGKGMHAPLSRAYKIHATSTETHDVCETAKGGKKVKGAVAHNVGVEEESDHKLFSIRQALARRKSYGKRIEQTPQDAATTIQRTFRDYVLRRSRTVHCLRDLAIAKSKLREIRNLFSSFSYRHQLEKDAEERQRFSEKIIILLLTVDAIVSTDRMARAAKRSMTHELEAVLDVVDPQLMRQRKFDLPLGTSMELASGVADVIRMLDQHDNGSSSLAIF